MEIPDPLRSEHLKEGAKPIMACVGTPEQFPEAGQELLRQLGKTKLSNIEYDGNPGEQKEQGFLNPGRAHTYVISPVDNSNKFSEGYLRCTGLIVAGLEKNTGENISFLSHQDPQNFLKPEMRIKFEHDLRQSITELKERCIEGTIDAVIAGGNYTESKYYQEIHLESVKLLSQTIQITLGFEPIVIAGPKEKDANIDNVIYDNKHRRVYILRSSMAQVQQDFLPSKIDDQQKKWDKALEDEARPKST